MISKKYFVWVGLVFAVLAFLAFYIGVAVILGKEILPENVLAFAIFSSLSGIIASIFVYLQRKFGFIIYAIGFVAGFISMLYSFSIGMDGWGDLIGLIQMMFILAISLGVAIVVETIIFVVDKSKKKKQI